MAIASVTLLGRVRRPSGLLDLRIPFPLEIFDGSQVIACSKTPEKDSSRPLRWSVC